MLGSANRTSSCCGMWMPHTAHCVVCCMLQVLHGRVAVNAMRSHVCVMHARHLVMLQPASPGLGSLPLNPLQCEGVRFHS